MEFSQHNIFSKIKDSENYFIVNILHGNADIISKDEAFKINDFIKNGLDESDFAKQLIVQQYFIDQSIEKNIYKNKYLDFIENREKDEIQIFYVPNYSCNFACSYCYQNEYTYPKSENENKVIDAFFDYISSEFSERKKYITIFGGEPLMSSEHQFNTIKYLIDKSLEFNIEISFVTNGYNLKDYINVLKKAKIREIQVTLDGTAKIHDNRRFLKNGDNTFERIVDGINICLKNKITINLRVVIDNENINDLPNLAKFAINSGWTKSNYFKTQIGRNYELHSCQKNNFKLLTRISLYEKIYEIIKKYPEVLEFHKPAFSVSKFLFENEELPDPLFDSCPACKTEWAFDYTGNIYSCTATVGKHSEALGTFYPTVSKKTELINNWYYRDVTEITECKSCNLQLACVVAVELFLKINLVTLQNPTADQ